MKKFLLFELLALTLCCCSKNEAYTTPSEIAVTLNYTFTESGNMMRSTGAEVYNNFYNNYIKSKVLTPSCYTLKFTNIKTPATSQIKGKWKDKDLIRLPAGEYLITGTSSPIETESQGCPSDTVYLNFNEIVMIKNDMEKLCLKAQYDSYLLFFDCNNYKEIYYYNDIKTTGDRHIEIKKDLKLADTHYMLFIKDLEYSNYSSDTGHYIKITRNNGNQGAITLDNFPFEKGKYYYFNDMAGSFDIPPMESGN